MADEIDDIVAQLKAASLENNREKTLNMLKKISSVNCKSLEKHDIINSFLQLLRSSNEEVCVETANCIAELAKNDAQRKIFTRKDVIEVLVGLLKGMKADNLNVNSCTQVFRALGNICYTNDDARHLLHEVQGDVELMRLLDVEMKECESNESQKFIKTRYGLFGNYLLGGETIAKYAMDMQIMEKIQRTIDKCVENVEEHEYLLMNTLPLLSILTENVADLNFDVKLNKQLAQILAMSTNPDLAELCLELLHYQADNDDVKMLLAKEGVCETIYQLVEKYKTLANSSEARALMKLACDLIVIILTGDESMHYLYTTPLLKNMEAWLDSYDIDLLTTGVLALGNFARTDSHCIYMVDNKVMNKLLEILSKNNGVNDDMRLQHALLSALKNLVIPKANKAAVVKAGLVQTILPMLEIHQPPVVFKLLGTLRMTVDGQESLAMDLLKKKSLIEQLVQWSKSSDYPGVMSESLRLMAWLIKHAHHSKAMPIAERVNEIVPATKQEQPIDDKGLRAFVQVDGAVESMVNMLSSQHLVMQNEALIALSILSLVFLCKSNTDFNLEDLYIQCDLCKVLAEFIKKSADSMTKEIVENLHAFTKLIKQSEKLTAHMDKHNMNELLKSTPILTEYCTL